MPWWEGDTETDICNKVLSAPPGVLGAWGGAVLPPGLGWGAGQSGSAEVEVGGWWEDSIKWTAGNTPDHRTQRAEVARPEALRCLIGAVRTQGLGSMQADSKPLWTPPHLVSARIGCCQRL